MQREGVAVLQKQELRAAQDKPQQTLSALVVAQVQMISQQLARPFSLAHGLGLL